MKAVIIIAALLSVGLLAIVGGVKQSKIGHHNSYPSLIKVPETLTLSGTHHGLPAILEDPDYNMVSLDGHHVGYIAENRLYYHRIPHQRMVLHHEDIRQMNGLPRHLLESVRPFFPFFVEY